VPASNAALAGALATRAGVPRFVWVAGSAAEVAAARYTGRVAIGGRAVGAGYDLVGRLAGAGGHRVVVGHGIVGGDGIVASLVEPAELRDVGDAAWPAIPWRLRLAWAGRLAGGKGLEVLLDTLALLVAEEAPGHRVELVILGDGPDRPGLEAKASTLSVADRIHWLGHVADRVAYMDALASCDLFVFPSPAEGFPKVVLDAMAVGLPVLATPSGGLGALVDGGIIDPVELDPAATAASVGRLEGDPSRAIELRRAGSTFVAAHTRPAEATRIVGRWRGWWPTLPWERSR
jgi:glycosyltransferase involved in cell wall biosynthesis